MYWCRCRCRRASSVISFDAEACIKCAHPVCVSTVPPPEACLTKTWTPLTRRVLTTEPSVWRPGALTILLIKFPQDITRIRLLFCWSTVSSFLLIIPPGTYKPFRYSRFSRHMVTLLCSACYLLILTCLQGMDGVTKLVHGREKVDKPSVYSRFLVFTLWWCRMARSRSRLHWLWGHWQALWALGIRLWFALPRPSSFTWLYRRGQGRGCWPWLGCSNRLATLPILPLACPYGGMVRLFVAL